MAQRQSAFEMQPRDERSSRYSGGYGDRYGAGSSGDKYDIDSRRDQYGIGPGGGYGMDPQGRQSAYDMGDGQGVVAEQPARMGFSSGPGFGSAPPGLEYLTRVDQLLVQQKIELCEIFTGCEMKNRYEVKNTMGQDVFKVVEDTNWCNRQCCGPIRPFAMQVFDGREVEVLHLNRPLRCQGCCCPCCLQQMEVCSGSGQVLGFIRERWTFCKPKLTVHRPGGEHVFTIRGPICKCSCGGDVQFRILTAEDEQEVGVISKQWSGLAKEFFTDCDTFGITFPMDLDVTMKATLFGALFLVDFMFFEVSNK